MNPSTALQSAVKDLRDLDLTFDQIKFVKYLMAQYAIAAILDLSIQDEACDICKKYDLERDSTLISLGRE